MNYRVYQVAKCICIADKLRICCEQFKHLKRKQRNKLYNFLDNT